MEGNWWIGENSTGVKGLFPCTFVGQDPSSSAATAAPAAASAGSGIGTRDGLPSAVALYDYQATKDSEVSFKVGDTLVQVRKMQGEWWRGAHAQSGARGYFPAKYVRLEESSSNKLTEQLKDKVFTTERPPHARALFACTGRTDTELTFRAEDVLGEVRVVPGAEWWEGTLRGKRGFFPADYVTLLDPALAAQVTPPVPFTGRAKFAFEGVDSNQLSFRPQEIVIVLATSGKNGWWAGKARGKVGFFPANAVKQLSPDDDGMPKVVPGAPSIQRPSVPPPLPPKDAGAEAAAARISQRVSRRRVSTRPSTDAPVDSTEHGAGDDGDDDYDDDDDESSSEDEVMSYQLMLRNMYQKEMAALAALQPPTQAPAQRSAPERSAVAVPPPPRGKCRSCGMINAPTDAICRQCSTQL